MIGTLVVSSTHNQCTFTHYRDAYTLRHHNDITVCTSGGQPGSIISCTVSTFDSPCAVDGRRTESKGLLDYIQC